MTGSRTAGNLRQGSAAGSGVIEIGHAARGCAQAPGSGRQHGEVGVAILGIGLPVFLVLVAEVPEIAVLAAGQLGTGPDDNGLTYVRGDVRDTDHVRQEILDIGIQKDIAFAAAHAGQMAVLEIGGQVRGHLAQGLDPVSRLDIALPEGQFGVGQDLFQKGLEDIELPGRQLREGDLSLRHALRVFRDVDGVVPQTLKFRYDLVVLVQDGDMDLVLEMGQEGDQVAADPVREDVDIDLLGLGPRINDVNQGDAGVSPLPLPDFRRCNHRRQWDIPLFNGEFFHQLTIMRITHRLHFIVLPVL